MPDERDQPTQKTQPKGTDEHGRPYEPVDIPVPEREEWLRNMSKVAPPAKQPDDDA